MYTDSVSACSILISHATVFLSQGFCRRVFPHSSKSQEMAASLLLGLMATHMGANPPAWPPAVHMSGHVNGTTGIMGIEVGPVTGPFEMWTSCDPQQPAQGKMKIIATTTAYGVTVLNTTVAQDCTPTTTTAGKLYENVA